MKTLLEIKNQYAQELGYKSWSEIMFLNNRNPIAVENHMNEICIRAQKASLEKAAESTSIQYVRPKTFNYKEIENFITNPENLIR